RLAAMGYRVVAIARSTGDSDFPLLGDDTNLSAIAGPAFVPFDLGHVDEIPQLVKKLHARLGPIYAIVNNAGIGTHGTLALMHNSRIEELVRINLISPIIL